MSSIKKNKFIVYLFFLASFFLITYFTIPKSLNFSVDSIKENLKNNNNINISNISKVNYKIFPTPRLSILNIDFVIGEEIFEVNNSELQIILNISQILNSQEINYKKLLIKNGSSKINLNNFNQVLTIISKNKKILTFKKNNLIFLQKNKFLFEIDNALIKVSKFKNKGALTLNGNFLKNKISLKLENISKNKNNLKLKIPELDISTRVYFEKDNSDSINGLFNLEVFNNFLKFYFTNSDNIKITKGFIRSKLVNSSIDGEITLKPNFFSILDFGVSNVEIEKLLPLIKKIYFSNNPSNLALIKKINGVFNFNSKFEGSINNKNGEILLEDFKIGKNKSLLFSAKIVEFGEKSKIQFNLTKTVRYKKNLSKKIKITGLLIPLSSKLIFKKILVNERELSIKKTKEYEKRFEKELIKNSLNNIFNENKIDEFFKNLF